MTNKRGISAIIATVLIILITVAAITIIWTVILPTIRIESSFEETDIKLSIIIAKGYTFYDKDSKTLYVQIKREQDDANIIGLDILVTIGGNTITFSYGEDEVPGINQKNVIVIRSKKITKIPESVIVVPVIKKGEQTERGSPSAKTIIPLSKEVKRQETTRDISGETPDFIIRFLQPTDTHIHIAGDPTASATDGRTDNCDEMGTNTYLKNFTDLYDQYCNTNLYDSLGGSILPTIAWIDAVAKMNQVPDVGFSTITGDLVAQRALDDNKKASIAKFVEIADTLNHDYHIIADHIYHDGVGDVDTYNYYVENIGPLDWNFTIGKNLFMGVSVYNETTVTEVLEANKDKGMTLFMFVHRVLMDPKLQRLLANYTENFRQIIHIQGHIHRNDYDFNPAGDGIHYITTTAIMNYPTEFRIFEIYEDRVKTYMSNITSPEVNNASEIMVDQYIYNQDNGLSPGLERANPDNKIGLYGDESERDFTIYLD